MPVEGRGLGSELTSNAGKDRRLGNLATPESVQKLRTALHAKAKEEPGFRFYALDDKDLPDGRARTRLCLLPCQ